MLGLPQDFSFNTLGGGCIVNSISEGYFSSINVAKYRKIHNLAFNDPKRLNLVILYLKYIRWLIFPRATNFGQKRLFLSKKFIIREFYL